MRLYHYTSWENFEKIWVNKTLLFSKSHVSSNNDFFERQKSVSFSEKASVNIVDNRLKHTHRQKTPNVFCQLNRYKQISFTTDGENGTLGCLSPMMWGHYADNGRGVCIELERDDLELPEDKIWKGTVNYVDELDTFQIEEGYPQTLEDINKEIEKKKDIIFFQKHKDWQTEREYRLVSNMESKLDILNAIKKVIVPNYEGKTSKLVQKLVNNNNILYFLNVQETNGHKKLEILPFPSQLEVTDD